MGLYEKIEEIRRQPEHIRMRYVWLMVTISMIFVLIIWIVSFKTGTDKDALLPDDVTNSEIVNQFNEQKETLKSATQGLNNVMQSQNTESAQQ